MNLKLRLHNHAGTKFLHLKCGKTLRSKNLELRTTVHYLCGVQSGPHKMKLKCRNHLNLDTFSWDNTVFITLTRPKHVVCILTICTMTSSAIVSVQSALPLCGGPWYTLGVFLRSTAVNRKACYKSLTASQTL